MNQKWKKILAIACASAFLFPAVTGCSQSGGAAVKTAEQQRTAFVSAMQTRVTEQADGVESKSIDETEGNTLISISYPFLAASQPISTEMEEFANGLADSFRSEAETVHAQDESAVCSLTVTYKPYLTDRGILSVKFTQSQLGTGVEKKGYVDAFSYNLSAGARLGLEDIFDASQDYLSVISAKTKEYLAQNEVLKKNLDQTLFDQGTAPTAENFDSFLMTQDSIIFEFNPGSIAPQEAGTFEVSIPLANFDSVFNTANRQLLTGAQATQQSQGNTPAGEGDYANYQSGLPQLQARDGFMKPGSLEGIDPWNDKVIALTFDDGPNPAKLPELLDILEKNDVVATFFMVGNLVQENPELVKRAYEEGNEIGTHSWNHPTSEWAGMSVSERLDQYTKANDAIQAVTGLRALIDRPVGGAMSEEMAQQIGREQIIWSMDPEDWKYKDADTVYSHVMEGWNDGFVQDGAVVLSHDIYQSTVDAYARIIPELKDKGYKFVTVTQMMQIAEIRGASLDYLFKNAPAAKDAVQQSSDGSTAQATGSAAA